MHVWIGYKSPSIPNNIYVHIYAVQWRKAGHSGKQIYDMYTADNRQKGNINVNYCLEALSYILEHTRLMCHGWFRI